MTKPLTPRQLGWLRGRFAIAQVQPSETLRLMSIVKLATDVLPDDRLVEIRERLTEEVRNHLPAGV